MTNKKQKKLVDNQVDEILSKQGFSPQAKLKSWSIFTDGELFESRALKLLEASTALAKAAELVFITGGGNPQHTNSQCPPSAKACRLNNCDDAFEAWDRYFVVASEITSYRLAMDYVEEYCKFRRRFNKLVLKEIKAIEKEA
mgnify:CR=1 FL=1|tara:strand:+ start:177 stop:602 length:426 start_codon:yes stop_codon:yes gene_type:complete